jgi:hypothetical protein
MTAEDNTPGSGIVREIASDGSIVIRDQRCACFFRRLRACVVEVRIVGTDSGQFGTAVIDEVALPLMRERPIELLLDAAESSIRSVAVTIAWARFFETNRQNLQRVTVLACSKATTLAMGLISYLSRTGDLIRIRSDRETYEARKAALASPQRSGD